jgi:hypothetical protein
MPSLNKCIGPPSTGLTSFCHVTSARIIRQSISMNQHHNSVWRCVWLTGGLILTLALSCSACLLMRACNLVGLITTPMRLLHRRSRGGNQDSDDGRRPGAYRSAPLFARRGRAAQSPCSSASAVFCYALGDDLVDRTLHERGRDRFAIPAPGGVMDERSLAQLSHRYASDRRNVAESCGVPRLLSICGAKNCYPFRGRLVLTGSTLTCWRQPSLRPASGDEVVALAA